MKILRYDNPAVTSTATTLNGAVSAGDTDITVTSATGFSANDFVLIEDVGNEKFEIRKISSISSSVITLTAAISYSHVTSVVFTKLDYDQYRIDYSTDGVTYTGGTLTDLNYAEPWNEIHYENIDLDDAYYFRIYYYNSHTTTADLQSTITPTDVFYGYISYTEFIARNGIDVTNSGITRHECEDAVMHGAEEIKRRIYMTRWFETFSQDTIFDMDLEGLEIADAGLSKGEATVVLDKYDVTTWEEDTNGIRTYRGNKIALVFSRRTSKINTEAKIEYSETMPATNTNKLVIQVCLTHRHIDEILLGLREVNSLLAINQLFTSIPFERLQYGMAGWSSGGTSQNFDQSMVQTIIENNEKRVNAILDKVKKFYSRRTTMQREDRVDLSKFVDTLRWS